MNPNDNTATPANTATNPNVAPVANNDTNKPRKIERSRTFKKVEAKTINIPVAGTFNAVLVGLAFIGTYTRQFKKGTSTTTADYEYVGMSFKYIDMNTGVEQIIHSEAALTYTDGSKLRSYIESINPTFEEGEELKKLLKGKVNITVTHTLGKNSNGEDKTYANITALVQHNANMPDVPVNDNEIQYFDILTDMANIDIGLNGKHRWLIQNKSLEHGSNPVPVDNPQPQVQQQTTSEYDHVPA